ncbi:lipid-A-disaccharide synthase [Methylocystis parvus]|uniref:Lipid-A-disaccharide synthase n=1 Tax=Methylocystis parvus TaxID=134 RepID=A0A6B8M195_9HYPH|nr:lipid-A-disaccharide synthase [Methylocystis parvus]QGM96108.1 lipid-A-disaccharide synthase [Methylocystis parvus]WBK00069.1 lipid-A-disaccharide synthase [Methylocystis parvus OBBP]
MNGPHIFLVVGETSGDALGAALMRALRDARNGVTFSGVGGAAMTQEGLASLFPMTDIAVMGLAPVIARLPTILARIEQTAAAALAAKPDCLVIVDAPDFTHRVARKLRAIRPELPIVDYVSPTVWAWRPGRARKMRAYIDCVLALLPFEPDAHLRLGGPRCVYVGHPLVERLDELTGEAHTEGAPLLLILPGSRRAEIERMTPLYGETLRLILADHPELDVAVPVAPHMEATLRRALQDWPVAPRLLTQAEKFPAFRRARAALVTSGVATLELALADTPMAVAYKVSRIEAMLRFLIDVHSIVLPNLVIGENAAPEFIQEQATPRALADALAPLLTDGRAREAQRDAFRRVRERLLEAGGDPSARAAQIVLEYAENRRR